MFIEIITPDKKVFEGEVDSATFPGTDGSFQVLNNHAPMISTLGTGDLRYKKVSKDKSVTEETITVRGGVVEVLNNKVVVLVESVLSE